MSNGGDVAAKLRELVRARVELESRLQGEPGEPGERAIADYERSYGRLQKALSSLFGESEDAGLRTTIMLELIRILENRLVYLQNFVVDPTSDNRMLASLVDRFIEELAAAKSNVLSPLESTYYRAIAALYAGDRAGARAGFLAACESEESDEANDIKYKSYVILGNLSHEEHDYERARDLHDASLRYSSNDNVTAQALAFKALNSYALGDYDEALGLFERALGLFDAAAPFFNPYFHRNALLFCGSIHYERKAWDRAAEYYGRVVEEVEQSSYDYFDALAQLGRIFYLTERFDEAADRFGLAIESHRFSENEYLVDTWYWLAKTRLRQNRVSEAKECLRRVTSSPVRYENKSKAVELLARVS
ncbi:MAG TPA: tetratricopeptide repeat protein [Thermoanaerobaculia bacterium]|nr:tetratricopeptide repeat protein [Thermoanaerobaculia bacterium]